MNRCVCLYTIRHERWTHRFRVFQRCYIYSCKNEIWMTFFYLSTKNLLALDCVWRRGQKMRMCVFILFSAPALLNYGWIVANKQNRWDAVIILTTNGFGTHEKNCLETETQYMQNGNGSMLKSMQFKCVNYGMYECWICVRLCVYFGCLAYCYTV